MRSITDPGAGNGAGILFGCTIEEYDKSVLATRKLMGLPDDGVEGQRFVLIDEDAARRSSHFEHAITPGGDIPLSRSLK